MSAVAPASSSYPPAVHTVPQNTPSKVRLCAETRLSENQILTLTPAMSEALAQEVACFGIRVLVVQPGGFRTAVTASGMAVSKPASAAYQDTPAGKLMARLPALNGKQRGDTLKGCQAIMDLVERKGVAEGIDGEFLRYPLGTDCATRMIAKVDELKRMLVNTKPIWSSTDITEGEFFQVDAGK